MPNPVVHFEIGCRDSAQAARFYTSLFGWSTSQMGPAVMVDTLASQGIQGHISALGHEPHHYTIFYVSVDDIVAYLAKAESLGAKTLVPKVDIPNYGSFAWLSDPDGKHGGTLEARADLIDQRLPSPALLEPQAHPIGSIVVARRAGIQQATPAVTVTNVAAIQRYIALPDSSPARKTSQGMHDRERRAKPNGQADGNGLRRPLTEDHRMHVARRGAEGHTDADLLCPPRGGVRNHAHKCRPPTSKRASQPVMALSVMMNRRSANRIRNESLQRCAKEYRLIGIDGSHRAADCLLDIALHGGRASGRFSPPGNTAFRMAPAARYTFPFIGSFKAA